MSFTQKIQFRNLIFFSLFSLVVLFSVNANAGGDLARNFLYSVEQGSARDVKHYISQGANPNLSNTLGRPALLIAAGRPDPDAEEIVRILLENGAEVDARDKNNETAIIAAVTKGTYESLAHIVNYYPSIDVKNRWGETLWEIAERRGDERFMRLVVAKAGEREAYQKQFMSQENLDRLINKFAYLNCSYSYLNFYSRNVDEDEIDPDGLRRVLNGQKEEIKSVVFNINRYFNLKDKRLDKIKKVVGQQITAELRHYFSQYKAKRVGIGTDADLKKRCTRLAAQWGI